MKKRVQKRIGAITLTGTALFIGIMAALFVYNETTGKGTVHIRFDHTGKINIDDTFAVRGHGFGTIEEFEITQNQYATISVELFRPLQIRRGYTVTVKDRGLFGKRAVIFVNGPPGEKIIPRSDTLQGIYQRGIMDILGEIHAFQRSFNRLRNTLTQVYGHLFTDDTLNNRFQQLLGRIDHLSTAVTVFLEDITGATGPDIAALRSKSGNIAGTTEKTGRNLRRLFSAADTLVPAITETIDTLNTLLRNDVSTKMYQTDTLLQQIDTRLDQDTAQAALNEIQQQLRTVRKDALRLILLLNAYEYDEEE
ncbi:MAG: MlaD family protein [Fibrobacterota bacterium]